MIKYQLLWNHSSAGRAHALQAWGHRFEPYWFHQDRSKANALDLFYCLILLKRSERRKARMIFMTSGRMKGTTQMRRACLIVPPII